MCPAGTYNDEMGASKCTKCPVGSYCAEGAGVALCPTGTYNFK